MKINEIPVSARVSLEIAKGDESDIVSVSLQKMAENVLVLMPIEIDGKVLVLKDKDLKIDVYYEMDNAKPIVWRNVAYGMVPVKGRQCIVLSTKSNGVQYNRRLNFRLPMDVQGNINGQKIIVHDLSSTGISFYVRRDNPKKIGTEFTMKFIANYDELAVQGKIVREFIDEDRILYGCSIKPSAIIDTFLAEEQRRRLMKNRGR